MKKLLLFTFIFFGLISKAFSTHNDSYYYDQPISFVENNVSFAIYQNGAFDFYIDRVAGFNISLHSPNVSLSFNSGYNYNAYVQYDRYGAVIQVENIPIYYDYYGRVSQIGAVQINYHNGYVSRVGGLYIYYNGRSGYPHYSGYINRYNRYHVHTHHHYFHYPRYEYVVVSHRPYRKHYRPERYVYHKNHKQNHYYKKRNHRYYAENSRASSSGYSRRATQDVPKSRADYNRVARRSGNDQAKELFKATSGVNESYYRRAGETSSRTNRNDSPARSKNTSEKRIRKEPVKRNATDLFKNGRPERIVSNDKKSTKNMRETSGNRVSQDTRSKSVKAVSRNSSKKNAAHKTERTKTEHYSRSKSKTKKAPVRNSRS